MNTISLNEEKNVFDFLRSEKCCSRCCLRFASWRTLDCYENPEKFVKCFQHSDIDSHINEVPCVVCLGLLEDEMQDIVIQKVVQEMKKQNHDCPTFTCALTVPVSVRLRERFMHARVVQELGLSDSFASSLSTKIQNLKDVWKLIVIPKIEKATGKAADLTTPSPFLIEIFLMYENDEKECKELLNICRGTDNRVHNKKRVHNDNKFSRKNIDMLMADISTEKFVEYFKVQMRNQSTPVKIKSDSIKIIYSHSSIFIGGRYNKLSRELSQTPWFINGEKKMKTSVQDILCHSVVEIVKADAIKFLSSGREDVDVRNIYSGRPFAIELVNPKMTNITEELLSNLVKKINKSSKQVQISSDLKVLTRLDLKKLKEGENAKTKFYRALCVCRSNSKELDLEGLNKLKRVKIVQRTPLRVLHRRPLSPRIRIVYDMRARLALPTELKRLVHTGHECFGRFFVLDVKTQAGTYVKEFVHGDFGRTKPSLCDLLNADVDIVALDVTGINLEWP
ncbi:hypothetical protein KM043_017564 [Ampulex compressa]|nr:hypothetical protein KM043_017564 [Ampulex compressa]